MGALAMVVAGCRDGPRASGDAKKSASNQNSSPSVVRIVGSDTMVNLVQAWAERYRAVQPDVLVEVAGGGSGVGIAAMIDGITDIAAASRELTADERLAAEARGWSPLEFEVAVDALAIYVHASNPISAIDLEQLAEIYGEGGRIRRWSQLAAHPGCRRDVVVRVGRQNSSGTYTYFRERVLGPRREFALGSIDQSGSKDVVALVSKTPCAIGYSGAAYATASVKVLRVARSPGMPAVLPSARTVADGSYPLARRLYFDTPRRPAGAVQAFLAWVVSAQGRQIAEELGFMAAAGASP